MAKRLILAAVLALALAPAAFAQGNPTGTISGRVLSDAGPLPGVTVSATSPNLQGSRTAVTTDNGDYILDCATGPMVDPAAIAAAVKAVPGVVEHGLFLGIARVALQVDPEGAIVRRERPASASQTTDEIDAPSHRAGRIAEGKMTAG